MRLTPKRTTHVVMNEHFEGEVDFGKRYGAAVLSVGREGEKIHSHERLASFRLRGGDTLLLVCRPDLASGQHYRVDDPATAGPDSGGDFITVSRVGGSSGGKMGVDYERMCLAPVIAAVMILVSTFELTSLLTASLCAAFIMIITGCMYVCRLVSCARAAMRVRRCVCVSCRASLTTGLSLPARSRKQWPRPTSGSSL